MAAEGRSRNWCFTVNNYTDSDIECFNSVECVYIVYGREVGESGTPHLQGYIEFKNQRHLGGMKKVHKTAHWEARRGTQKQAIDYCMKDGDFIERGEIKAQGKRTDLASACEAIKAKSFDPMDFPEVYAKYSSGLDKLRRSLYKDRDPNHPPEILWLYGKAGVGKTKYAMDKFGVDEVYIKNSTKWWAGYRQQKCILVDDFDGSWPYRDFLRFLDRYPYTGEVKGGDIPINSPHIIITCEFPPYKYYNHGNELDQVTRRLKAIMEVGSEVWLKWLTGESTSITSSIGDDDDE